MSTREDCYAYVRRTYGVPAYIGVPVRVRNKAGVLVKSRGDHYVYILIEGEKRASGPYHPTDVEYQP